MLYILCEYGRLPSFFYYISSSGCSFYHRHHFATHFRQNFRHTSFIFIRPHRIRLGSIYWGMVSCDSAHISWGKRESHSTVWGWPGSWRGGEGRGEEGGEKEGSLFLFKRYQKHSQVSQSVAYERAELRVGVEDRCGGERRRGEVRNINKSINIKIPSPRNAVM